MNDFSIKSSTGYDAPRWYLWDGGFLALGRSEGVIQSHAHHAIQIVISIDGAASICGADGEWRSADIGNPEWVEKGFDYENQQGISTGKILGFKKPQFYSQYSGGTTEDFGVLSLYVAQ